MDGHDADESKQSTADMTAFDGTLGTKSSSADANKIPGNMGSRIDELEQSINDLKTEMGVEGSPSPSLPSNSKPKTETGSPIPKIESKSGEDSA
ncbi:hypothetical protein F8388_012951 [Cannabis sativa]|uniref:Uncharacterized protein n=1 Tax=Cannabis sativa TaxID=3483 RepID=A0A7J6HF63_CANSA|nr:hypothetical protein F8388_012951 [Cannabis sativa]KAF4365071.1 hypothetical protein G4B88_018251 [Cannabis sativa]KAF4393705.1 hypothetical protein G4B88_007691 [Cannabis sativa]